MIGTMAPSLPGALFPHSIDVSLPKVPNTFGVARGRTAHPISWPKYRGEIKTAKPLGKFGRLLHLGFQLHVQHMSGHYSSAQGRQSNIALVL